MTFVIGLLKLDYDNIYSTQYLNGWLVELGGEELFASLDGDLFWFCEDHGGRSEIECRLAQVGTTVSDARPPAVVPCNPATQKLISLKVDL